MAENRSDRQPVPARFLPLILLGLILMAGLLIDGCAVNPVSGQSEYMLISDDYEIQLGTEADKDIKEEYGVYEKKKLTEYVNGVGQKIAQAGHRPNIKYHFTVLDTPIINAFALPGGYVYITRGLLAYLNSEAEMASVLGHEVGHIAAKHGAKRLSTVLTFQILSLGASYAIKGENVEQIRQVVGVVVSLGILGYGRENEFQADSLGTSYAAEIGYEPGASIDFLKTIRRLEGGGEQFFLSQILASHPPTKERIKKTETLCAEIKEPARARVETAKTDYQQPPKYLVGASAYLQQIDGLLWGFPLSQGVVEGDAYKNKIYHFGLKAPRNWKLSNATRSCLATLTGPDGNMQFMIQGRSVDKSATPLKMARSIEKDFALTKKEEKSGWFQGQTSYLVYYEGTVDEQELAALRLYWIYRGRGYIFSLITVKDKLEEAREAFRDIRDSLWILSAEEEAAIKEKHLRLYTVKAGDNWQELAARYRDKWVSAEQKEQKSDADLAKDLAEFNGYEAGEFPGSGTLIKLLPY